MGSRQSDTESSRANGEVSQLKVQVKKFKPKGNIKKSCYVTETKSFWSIPLVERQNAGNSLAHQQNLLRKKSVIKGRGGGQDEIEEKGEDDGERKRPQKGRI